MRTHRQIDELNLAMDRAVVAKLRANPHLFAKVRENLRRWRQRVDEGDPSTRRYLERWETLASQGTEACFAMALEESQTAAAMRQAAPFAGILTADERMTIIRAHGR
jgi:hypothetical protein